MDWLFESENGICDVRVSGLIVKENKILVQRPKNRNEYALPGGHLKFGETTQEALEREYKEETGADIICRRLLWVEECFWEWNSKPAHNISFYYLADFCGDFSFSEEFKPFKDNDDMLYGWISIDKLNNIEIYPQFLKKEIFNLSECPKHFVSR